MNEKNVLEYFEHTLLQYRYKTAIKDEDRELTFGAWEQCAKRLSFSIRRRFQDMKNPVAVFLPKSADSLVAFMGILYSGNIYAPWTSIRLPQGSSISWNTWKPRWS